MTTESIHPLDALHDELEALPRNCPTWCADGHEVAVLEGCTGESARSHASPDYGDALMSLANPYTGEVLRRGGQHWGVQVEATVGSGNGWQDAPYIYFEVSERETADASLRKHIKLKMTPDEVKVLARTLDHLADEVILSNYKPTTRTVNL